MSTRLQHMYPQPEPWDDVVRGGRAGMSSERYRLDVSHDVLQTLQDTICIRKVDVEMSVREATARAERARASQDDELAAMAEEALSVGRAQLVKIETARHLVFSARPTRDARIARLARKVRR